MTISELEGLKDKTEDQLKYLDWYYKKMPVSVNDCTMNYTYACCCFFL